MLGLSFLSLALMVVDQRSDYLDYARVGLNVLVKPVWDIANYPNKVFGVVEELFASRDQLEEHIADQDQELLFLRVKTQEMAALRAENNRLRDLLGSAAKLQDNVLVGELVGVDPDPNRHEVVIDKGLKNDVFVGQPVLDAMGLMGQVIEVGVFTSRVLLISDQSHSVPVQVVRSNLRLIARGTGTSRQLELMHLQDTADIRLGDELVSSGLGNRFPVGYPVGTVDKIDHDPGKPFATATAIPSALLNRTRHVLLVFTEKNLNKTR
jgi:rod shape-determining protein MreC